MNELNLVQIARELLAIHEDLPYRINEGARISDFELETFTQVWGNTSGGFEGVGGSMMTSQRTYVFIPQYSADENCYVYFGGRFAYLVPYSEQFMSDVKAHNVAGVYHVEKYNHE